MSQNTRISRIADHLHPQPSHASAGGTVIERSATASNQEGDLLEEVKDGVAILTMNRPTRRNAMSPAMLNGLLEALPRLATDSSIGCIILTGAGKGFCAGGDVKSMASGHGDGTGRAQTTLEQYASGLRSRMEISRLLHEIPKPTIAMIRGAAAGAGLSLALACDMRVAAENTKFTTAFAKVGFSGDFGGSYFLSKIVGTAKARELYYTADVILSDEAEHIGMVNKVVKDSELEKETFNLARKCADGAVIALRYMKKNMNLAENSSLHDCLDAEAWHHSRTGFTEDHKEATKAFVEKRKPSFKGR